MTISSQDGIITFMPTFFVKGKGRGWKSEEESGGKTTTWISVTSSRSLFVSPESLSIRIS